MLWAYVLALNSGSGLDISALNVEQNEDDETWQKLGRDAFQGEKGEANRMDVVDGALQGSQGSGWCDEQVSFLFIIF